MLVFPTSSFLCGSSSALLTTTTWEHYACMYHLPVITLMQVNAVFILQLNGTTVKAGVCCAGRESSQRLLQQSPPSCCCVGLLHEGECGGQESIASVGEPSVWGVYVQEQYLWGGALYAARMSCWRKGCSDVSSTVWMMPVIYLTSWKGLQYRDGAQRH